MATTAPTKESSANKSMPRARDNTRLIHFLIPISAITLLLSLIVINPPPERLTALLKAAVLLLGISPLLTICYLMFQENNGYYQMIVAAAINEETVYFHNKPYSIASIDINKGKLTLQNNDGIKITASYENISLDNEET